MAKRGTNGAGHAEDLLLFASNYGYDFVALQETRRDGKQPFQRQSRVTSFTAVAPARKTGINDLGTLGVSLVITESIVSTLGLEGIIPEQVSARMLKV